MACRRIRFRPSARIRHVLKLQSVAARSTFTVSPPPCESCGLSGNPTSCVRLPVQGSLPFHAVSHPWGERHSFPARQDWQRPYRGGGCRLVRFLRLIIFFVSALAFGRRRLRWLCADVEMPAWVRKRASWVRKYDEAAGERRRIGVFLLWQAVVAYSPFAQVRIFAYTYI